MFTIKKRYQYRGAKGITWTSWYNYSSAKTQEEADQLVKDQLKKDRDSQRGRFKLLSEYEIEPIKATI